MKEHTKHNGWKRIPWDGNPALKLECWRKGFRHGHVSVGIGEFTTVVFSYGKNSDRSFSSTRWNKLDAPMTEAEAMSRIDSTNGRFLPAL